MDIKKLYKLIREGDPGIATDSRSVKTGDVFFALKGDNFNGNAFASGALENGARLAVIDDPVYSGSGTILVGDVLLAMQELAAIHRRELGIPVIAITGTNGKTTTKELTALVLSQKYKVHSTKGNLNNHIGVPLTILSAGRDTELLLVEMGANHIGEIDALCRIADPDYGIITNIGKAHLEGFGSYEGVIKAKSELYSFLDKKGAAIIYNDNNSLLSELAASLSCSLIPYSRPSMNLALSSTMKEGSIEFDIHYGDSSIHVNTGLYGSHNLENIQAAVSIGLVFDIDISVIARAIASYKPENNRSQLADTGKNLLLCDAYNANPGSMMSALRAFIKAEEGRDKTIILGDMLELGQYSMDEHKKIIDFLSATANIRAYLVGTEFCRAAGQGSIKCFASTELLIKHLESNPIRNNFVLLKGSRGIALEKVFPLL